MGRPRISVHYQRRGVGVLDKAKDSLLVVMNNLQREIWNLLDEKQPLNHRELFDGVCGVQYDEMHHEILALQRAGLIIWEGHGYRFTTKQEEFKELKERVHTDHILSAYKRHP